MDVLLDTSVLGRLANRADAFHTKAQTALVGLRAAGHRLHITPQCLIEFRSAATRPKSVNGLGLTVAEADTLANTFESQFHLLPDTPAVYPAWKRLVTAAGVVGKQVHDARLVAVCDVHAAGAVLTFNVRHFTRPAAVAGVTVLDARTV